MRKIPSLVAAMLAGGVISAAILHPHTVTEVKAAVGPRIPVHVEADGAPGTLLGTYTVDQLRIVCGFGTADGWQVVTVASTGRMGYAPVSDRRCAK